MKTQCPHCRTFFNIKPEYIGKKTKCKKCAQGFTMYEFTAAAVDAMLGATAKSALASSVAAKVAAAGGIGRNFSASLSQAAIAGAGRDIAPQKASDAPARVNAVASAAPAAAVARRTDFPSPAATSFDNSVQPSGRSVSASKKHGFAEMAVQAEALPPKAMPADDHSAALPFGAGPEFMPDSNLPLRWMPQTVANPSLNAFDDMQAVISHAMALPDERPSLLPTADTQKALKPPLPVSAVQATVAPFLPEPAFRGAVTVPRPMPGSHATVVPPTPVSAVHGVADGAMPDIQAFAIPKELASRAKAAPALKPRPGVMAAALQPRPVKGGIKPTTALPNPMPGLEATVIPPRPIAGISPPKQRVRAVVPPGFALPRDFRVNPGVAEQAKLMGAVQTQTGLAKNKLNSQQPDSRKIVATAPTSVKRIIPTSWTAALPTNVYIDGQPVTQAAFDDLGHVEPYASPLPLDVQFRLDDRQAITIEVYDAPLLDKAPETAAALLLSPIELDENKSGPDEISVGGSSLEMCSEKEAVNFLFGENSANELLEAGDLADSAETNLGSSSFRAGPELFSSISVVDRLPIFEPGPLKIGAIELFGRRRAGKVRPASPRRVQQLPPPGFRSPMFPRIPGAPENLVAPEFLKIYEPKGPGNLTRALIFSVRTVFRAFKSVFTAAYWFFKRQFDKIPRPVLTSSLACLLIGLIAGAWTIANRSAVEINELQIAVVEGKELLRVQQSSKIGGLYKERDRLGEDLLRLAAISRDYPEGSIPRTLAQAASEEFKIADTLLLQQIVAIESGAKVTVSVKQTTPDPDLASILEKEIERLQSELGQQLQTAQKLTDAPKMLADTSVATQLVNLSILNRNHLVAKYGLNSPLTPQYQSNVFSSDLELGTLRAASDDTGANDGDVPGLMDELRHEIYRLRAENELLLNADSTLYASAVNDMGGGLLNSAKGKFTRLLKVYPGSNLVPKAQEGLAQVKVMSAQKEAAKRPPVQVAYTRVLHDGGYLKNETYVRVSFKNVSSMMIKRLEFQVLTFDEHGYPVGSKRLGMTDDNTLSAVTADNVPPGKDDYGIWELSDKVRQVKVKLKEAEFYDVPAWRDEDIGRWVEKESIRFIGVNAKPS